LSAPSIPSAHKRPWFVWLKAYPQIHTEVFEQFWADARDAGARAISQRTGAEILLDAVDAAPLDSNLVHLEVERMRRKLQRARPAIR